MADLRGILNGSFLVGSEGETIDGAEYFAGASGGTIPPEAVKVKVFPARSRGAGPEDQPEFDPDREESTGPKIQWHGDAMEREERQWLVEDLVPERGTGLLSGQWGTGKTFIALDLAASVMTGTPFAGRNVARRGGVLFIAAEGADEIPVRLKGLASQKLGLGEGERLPFAWIEDCVSLRSDFKELTKAVKAVGEAMERRFGLPLAVIVVDTLNAAAEFKDGNDAAEAQVVMNRLASFSKKSGAFVFAIDHFGKVSDTGTRGSSAKEGACDVVLALLGERDLAGNVGGLRMAVRKMRGGTTGVETPFDLRVVEIGEKQRTCVVEWRTKETGRSAEMQAPTVKDRWPGQTKILRDALNEALALEGRSVDPFGDGQMTVKAASREAVRREFYARHPADGEDPETVANTRRKAFSRALATAVERKLVGYRDASGDELVWIVEGA